MALSVVGMSQEQSSTADGLIQGSLVRFVFDPEEANYTKTFAQPSAGEESVLAGLREDTDLRSMLPDRQVEEGDRWSVPNSFLRDLLMPGGFLGLDTSQMEMGDLESEFGGELEGIGELVAQWMESSIEFYDEFFVGSCQAVHAGTLEKDGRRVARVELEIDFEPESDLIAPIESGMALVLDRLQEVELPADFSIDISRADLAMLYSGQVTVYWDLDANVLHSLRGELETETEFDFEMELIVEDESIGIAASIRASGPYEVEVTVRKGR